MLLRRAPTPERRALTTRSASMPSVPAVTVPTRLTATPAGTPARSTTRRATSARTAAPTMARRARAAPTTRGRARAAPTTRGRARVVPTTRASISASATAGLSTAAARATRTARLASVPTASVARPLPQRLPQLRVARDYRNVRRCLRWRGQSARRLSEGHRLRNRRGLRPPHLRHRSGLRRCGLVHGRDVSFLRSHLCQQRGLSLTPCASTRNSCTYCGRADAAMSL